MSESLFLGVDGGGSRCGARLKDQAGRILGEGSGGPGNARLGDHEFTVNYLLRAFIERVERLEEEKKTIADDIKEVFAEMKGVGFDTKAVRAIIRLRKKDQAERQEEEAILDLYKAALGME